jgi:hypothetical protein
MASRPERGSLMMADITGYTAYLAGTELDHAHDVLADLMGTVVGSLRPMLRLAKLEGDAAFVYAPEGKIKGSMLLDMIEQCYFRFRRRLRDIALATTCPCTACERIPSLDLKLMAHDGEFVRHRVAGREELAGTDVVLVHRLLKNRVGEITGLDGYALFTEACLRAVELDPAALGMSEHVEVYDHLGEVRTYVHDLQGRWADEQAHRRVYIDAGDAINEFVFDLAHPPALVWDYLTAPGKRAQYGRVVGIDGINEFNPKGRRGPGTTNHCMHGPDTIVEEVLDWRPFDYFTMRFTAFGLTIDETIALSPANGGTRVTMRQRVPRSKQAREQWARLREMYAGMMQTLFASLAEALAGDDAAGDAKES